MAAGLAPGVMATTARAGSSTGGTGTECAMARTFPPPTGISGSAELPQERRCSAAATSRSCYRRQAGWRAYVAASEATFPADMLLHLPVDLETRKVGTATCRVLTPQKIAAENRAKVRLNIHGGGWVLFGGKATAALGKVVTLEHGVVTYAVDYRMPPDHPFPAGLDDCFAVYAGMLKHHDPADILVSGGSAGGNLAAALMLKVRDAGLPTPAAVVLNTPVTDLTNAGDSWTVLDGLDPVLRDRDGVGSTALYVNGNNPREPYPSPLFGKLGDAFPSTHLVTGTRDRLLSDTVRFHAALRAADVPTDLHVVEAMPRADFGGMVPEDRVVLKDTQAWLREYWPRRLRG